MKEVYIKTNIEDERGNDNEYNLLVCADLQVHKHFMTDNETQVINVTMISYRNKGAYKSGKQPNAQKVVTLTPENSTVDFSAPQELLTIENIAKGVAILFGGSESDIVIEEIVEV